MTDKNNLQQAITSCKEAIEKYTAMADKTDDTAAKQMYEHMCTDMDKHLEYLNGRLNKLND